MTALGRRDVLRGTAATLLLAAGLPPAAARAINRRSTDPATPDDRAALNFMTQAEQLQLALYEAGSRVRLRPAVRALVAEALAQERRHVEVLAQIARLHRVVPDRPRRYDLSFADELVYLRTLQRVEDAVVRGYGGVAVALDVPSTYLPDLVPIIADEMAQAAAITTLLGEPGDQLAFTDPQPPAAVQPVLDTPQDVATG